MLTFAEPVLPRSEHEDRHGGSEPRQAATKAGY